MIQILPLDSPSWARWAEVALARCDQLARCSDDPSRIDRSLCRKAMADAHRLLSGWMREAGMSCRVDAATNLIGRWEPPGGGAVTTLIVGSHVDTVPDAGRYDGVLGVVLAIGLVDALRQSRMRLPFAVEVVAFCDEEGVRYGAPFIGSLSVTGQLDEDLLNLRDRSGVPLREALRVFGGRPDDVRSAELDPQRVLGFLEPHIEQGPVLADENLPLGVVGAIAGQTRAAVRFRGRSGHAGTVPMSMRRDALAGAAEWIGRVESLARETEGLVATVGVIDVAPGTANVIPGEARLSLDVRHARDETRESAYAALCRAADGVAERRRIEFTVDHWASQPAVATDRLLSRVLCRSLEDIGVSPRELVSGAGHDAAVMASRFPIAMLFIRCRDGISHHPDESVEQDDVAQALRAMWRFVGRLAADDPDHRRGPDRSATPDPEPTHGNDET